MDKIKIYIARVSKSANYDEGWDEIIGTYKNRNDAVMAIESYFRDAFMIMPDEEYIPGDFEDSGYFSEITTSILL